MSSSFLILHGIENHRPPEHWQSWLAAPLQELGHPVLYPGLPDPDASTYDVWANCLHAQLTELVGDERVVICHSLACLLWFRTAAELSDEQRIDRLLLVSPPASDRVPKAGTSFRLEGFDAPGVLGSVRGEVRIACSDADPYNPEGAQQLYGTQLGITADVSGRRAHHAWQRVRSVAVCRGMVRRRSPPPMTRVRWVKGHSRDPIGALRLPP